MEVREIIISEILGSLCRMRLEKDYKRERLLPGNDHRAVIL